MPRSAPIPSLAAALALCAGSCAQAESLQPVTPVSPPPNVDRVAPTPILDGSSFAGLALTTDPQPGDARLGALRATVWTTGDAQRAVLEGDVRLDVGGYSLRADRAAVWIETLYPAEGERLRQIAVYLDNARDPLASAGQVVAADRLLVTVVVSGDVLLKADSFLRGRPTDDPFLVEGERRMARFLIDSLAVAQAGEAAPLLRPVDDDLRVPRSALRDLYATSAEIEAAIPPPDDRLPPVREGEGEIRPASQGVVTFSAPDVALLSQPDERAVVLTGGVALQQVDASSGKTVQLTATRAVVFLEPGDLLAASTPTEAVRGVYLEGDVVATDGSYTLRGAQVFYDPQTQKAILVDAVFWTYDEVRGIPIYARAKTIRQESERQWTANDVRLSNAAFAEPTLSIGARSVTVTRVEPSGRAGLRAGGDGRPGFDATLGGVLIDARSPTFTVGGAPVLPLPRYSGNLSNPPLRRIQVDSRAGSPVLRTTWDLESLANLEFGPGFEADLLVDGYFDRGLALGLEASWSTPESFGEFFGYGILDNGEDRFATGREIERDNDLRGLATFEHALRLNSDWTLFVEAAVTSDPAYVAAFFPGIGETAREFSSGVALRRVRDNEYFLVRAQGALQDWVPNEYLLQTPGAVTQRLPEAAYARVADGLFDGPVTYSSE
ncbi:MAG: hypothetical protein ACTS27_10030, partial [Phycisphaerales bacterium]